MRIMQLHNQGKAGATDTPALEVGATEVMMHEADLLRAAGHQVERFTLPPAEDLGLTALRLGLKAVWNAESFRDVSRLIASFEPDVAHVHTPFPVLSPSVFHAANRRNIPTVATLHGFRYSCIAGTCFRGGGVCEDCIGKRLKAPGVRHRCYHGSLAASGALTLSLALHRTTFLRTVDRFIALTPFAKRLLVRDGIPCDQIIVKPNSVPDPGVGTDSVQGSPYVAFVGRLIDIKGVRTLLEAWRHLPRGRLTLRIAGDGPLRELVEQSSRDDDSIHYVGWLEEPAVYDLIAGAQCLVVPSEWYEGGLPLVLLRALAVGTPVVVPSLDSISEEVVKKDIGITFEVGNRPSLALALRRVTEQPARFREMRPKARQCYLDGYSPELNLSRIESLYEQVISERGRS